MTRVSTNSAADRRTKRSYKIIPQAIRERAIDMVANQGWKVKAAAATLGVNPSALAKTVSRARNRRIEEGARPRGRAPRLSDAQREIVCDWVDDDCSKTLAQLAEDAKNEFGFPVSVSTIRRSLKAFHFSFKVVSKVPERRNCERTLQLRKEYALNFTRLFSSKDRFVFVDEVGFSCSLRVRGGWSHQTERTHISVGAVRSQNYSVAAAMTAKGLVMYTARRGAYNGDAFSAYITELLEKLREASIGNAVVVMDNVAFHKVQVIQNTFRAHGHTLLFLPPYSPFLNPIEEFFSKWKGLVRRSAPRTEQQLYAAIENCSQQVTESDCAGYFRHMEDYIHPSLMGEKILS